MHQFVGRCNYTLINVYLSAQWGFFFSIKWLQTMTDCTFNDWLKHSYKSLLQICLTRRHHTPLVHGTQTECKHTSTTNLKQETRKNIHITVDIFITTLIYDKTNADSPCPLSAGYSLQIFTVRSSLHEASLWPSASKHKLHTVDVCPCKVARHSQSSSSSL